MSLNELIDLRSFSNLWFWIALAVTWALASHWVMGIPYDMLVRARMGDTQAMDDLHHLARINAARVQAVSFTSAPWLLALWCFVMSGLVTLGFFYGVELAQAVALLALPLSIVGLLTLRTARKIENLGLSGLDLCRQLAWLRMEIQGIGLVAIVVTAVWGMYQNLSIGVLGH
ncbi:component of SufBCD complex [Chachezhania sediminis]|uniref:component of SufBCD complex n=1 Tax=Chachezhania sediminis TaxID=2599291 RepID=UPI00131ED0C0|nr:component of SufBCD complex [Chachezhania sediminis]